MIRIRHIVKFTDFRLQESTPHYRERMSSRIHDAIDKGEEINMKQCFLVSFPDNSVHNHLIGEIASLVQPIDKDLKVYIKKMVAENNITNSTQMKIILDVYVTQVLFKDKAVPPKFNSRFWPTLKDIRNHILLALREIRNANVDQKIVEEQVKKWKSQHPEDSFHLRLKEEESLDELANDNSDFDAESGMLFCSKAATTFYGSKPKFLYIHQTAWQQRLLLRYGNEISLLDATYRTTKYALPLFFLCIPTNVNYICVASFVLETGDQVSIVEALTILKTWNPEWKPQYFMCDYAEEEISALENVFPESMVYLCDFHREQSWERWLSTSHNGLTKEKEFVLPLLRAVAKGLTIPEYQDSLAKLQESHVWLENSRLRNWFSRYWLSKAQRWVKAYRHDRFNVSVNTNNGVERQNKTLKYEYLQQRKSSTLSHLLSVIVDNFLPDAYKRYLQLNLSFSDQHRAYAEEIPLFLHNRPRNIVDVCYKRWLESEHLLKDDIEEIADGLFFVKSQTNNDMVYAVNYVANDSGLPSCTCFSWIKTHLPCKHFFVVFRHFDQWGWESLPLEYRKNPMVNLDMVNPCVNQNSCPHTESSNQCEEDDDITGVINIPVSLPIPSQMSIRKERQRVLGQCQQIKELVHHCKDPSVLSNLGDQLNQALFILEGALPKLGPFIREDGDMIHIGTSLAKKIKKCYVKRQTDKRILNKLPIHRRKKIAAGRHGQKAEMIRKMHTTKGVEELAKIGKDQGFVQRNHTSGEMKNAYITEEAILFRRQKMDQLQEKVLKVYPEQGLLNPTAKNLCFANALLQCLRLTDLHKILQHHINCKETSSCFTCSLQKFIHAGPSTAEPLCKKMSVFWKDYKVGQQQDCHELLQKMLEEIQHKCLCNETPFQDKTIFYGEKTSSVTCTSCFYETRQTEIFTDISISIEKFQTLSQAIDDFFNDEQVQWKCHMCKEDRIAIKKTKLQVIPQNIIVQLQRFNGARRKVMKNIDIHYNLQLKKYTVDGMIQDDNARLFGVVVHKGNALSNGHYYCFVEFGSQWYQIDDTRIEEVPHTRVKNCDGQPYLLFYRTEPTHGAEPVL